jgi:hypothetical protein
MSYAESDCPEFGSPGGDDWDCPDGDAGMLPTLVGWTMMISSDVVFVDLVVVIGGVDDHSP